MVKMSRQRRWQIKMQKEGRCTICGKKAVDTTFCQYHLEINRERSRARYRQMKGNPT